MREWCMAYPGWTVTALGFMSWVAVVYMETRSRRHTLESVKELSKQKAGT